MDILKMLAELRAEREQVEEAIIVLERLARGRGKRRGRPPKWMTGMKRRDDHPAARINRVRLLGNHRDASNGMNFHPLRVKGVLHIRSNYSDVRADRRKRDLIFES